MPVQFEEGSGKVRAKPLYSDFTRMLLFEDLYGSRVVFTGPLEIVFALPLSKSPCDYSLHLTCFSIEQGENTEDLPMFPFFISSVTGSKDPFKFIQVLYQVTKLVCVALPRMPILAGLQVQPS